MCVLVSTYVYVIVVVVDGVGGGGLEQFRVGAKLKIHKAYLGDKGKCSQSI